MPITHSLFGILSKEEVSKHSRAIQKKFALSGSFDNNAIIWNVETATPVHKFKKHSSQVFFTEFSHDDCYVITASDDKTVKIWNILTGEDVASRNVTNTPRYTFMFNPNAPMYFIAGETDIHIYQLYSPREIILLFRNRYKNIEFTQEEKDYYSIK